MPPFYSLSTLYKCSLTAYGQRHSFHKIPLIKDCCNHEWSCTLVSPYLTIATGIISSYLLVRGNFKYTQFSREHWYLQYSNSQPLPQQVSAVSNELTWLNQSEQICKWGNKYANSVTTDHVDSTWVNHYLHTKFYKNRPLRSHQRSEGSQAINTINTSIRPYIQRDNINLSGPSSLAGGQKTVSPVFWYCVQNIMETLSVSSKKNHWLFVQQRQIQGQSTDIKVITI